MLSVSLFLVMQNSANNSGQRDFLSALMTMSSGKGVVISANTPENIGAMLQILDFWELYVESLPEGSQARRVKEKVGKIVRGTF